MTIGDIIIAYLLAVALVPLCICAYTLTGAMPNKDASTAKVNQTLKLAVRLATPYIAVITIAFCWAVGASVTQPQPRHGLTQTEQQQLERLESVKRYNPATGDIE